MAKTVEDGGETSRGENTTTRGRQRLIPRIRFVMVNNRLLPEDEDIEAGQDTPLETGGYAAIVQPLNGARWWDGEMPEGFRMGTRPKGILIAWGRRLVSWRKEIKVE